MLFKNVPVVHFIALENKNCLYEKKYTIMFYVKYCWTAKYETGICSTLQESFQGNNSTVISFVPLKCANPTKPDSLNCEKLSSLNLSAKSSAKTITQNPPKVICTGILNLIYYF